MKCDCTIFKVILCPKRYSGYQVSYQCLVLTFSNRLLRFQDKKGVILLLTSPSNLAFPGVRFVSIRLCMLIACPSLIYLPEHKRKSMEWIQQSYKIKAVLNRKKTRWECFQRSSDSYNSYSHHFSVSIIAYQAFEETECETKKIF